MINSKLVWIIALLYAFAINGFQQQYTITTVAEIQELFFQKPKLAELAIDAVQCLGIYEKDQDELLYLTEPDLQLSASWLEYVWSCIVAKQAYRINKVQLYVSEQKTVEVVFDCQAQPIFSGVTIYGYFVGKQQYKNLYMQQVGAPFDQKLHEHSIAHIQEYLYKQGYYSATVESELHYTNDKSAVAVFISIKRGFQFKLGRVSINFKNKSHITKETQRKLRDKFQNFFYKSSFWGYFYSDKYLHDAIRRIKSFLKSKGFVKFDVSPRTQTHYHNRTVDVVLDIELQRKKELVFIGNYFFSSHALTDAILLYGDAFWNFPHTLIADEVKQLYHQKGFWDVVVRIKEEKNRIFCIITEGKRSKVQKVICKDCRVLSAKELGLLFAKVENHMFSRDTLDLAERLLLQKYKELGYWNAQIIKEDFAASSKHNLTVYLTVDEGDLLYVSKLGIDNWREVPDAFPGSIELKVAGKIPVTKDLIQQQKQWLMSYFAEHKKDVSCEYTLEQQEKGNSLVWSITPMHENIQFGKVILQGNSQVPFSQVIQEFDFAEGEAWNRKKIDTTVQRLRDLDVFESVGLYPTQKVPALRNKKPLILSLEQAKPYEARVRAGLQYTGGTRKAVTYKAGGNMIVRNPFKTADKLEAGIDATRFYRNLFAQYHMPLLFSGPVRSLIRAYGNHYDQPVYLGSRVPLYKAGQQGILFSVQRKFETLNYGLTFGCEAMSLQGEIDDFASVIEYDANLLGKKSVFVYAEPGLMFDKRNHFVNPTAGFFTLASCKAMIDVSRSSSFFRCTAEHIHYIPLSDRFTAAIRARAGHIFNRRLPAIHPVERFYLGGPHSVRSYFKDYAPPLGALKKPLKNVAKVPKSGNGLWRYVPQGARTLCNVNFELRCQVYKSFDFVVFHDLGALWKDTWDNVQDHLVMGTGFGVRYQTPIGPLRFDIAWKWKRTYNNFELPYSWFISLGHAF